MRILIVDDSPFFRRLLHALLEKEPGWLIVGEAADGDQAVDMACRLKPDVITMDIEMPGTDGIAATRRIMERCPTPILMLSSVTRFGAQATFDALEAGAMDFMLKVNDGDHLAVAQQLPLLRAKIRLLVGARRDARPASPRSTQRLPEFPPSPVSAPAMHGREARSCERVLGRRGIVLIGASTGGPAAVQRLLQDIPGDFSVPILVLQHMPPLFTHAFAERLDRVIPLTVKEAEDGEEVLPGHVYIAPGGRHTQFGVKGGRPVFVMREPRANEHFRPSVDIGFSSAASTYRVDLLGIVLTGMGNDGVHGARALKAVGGRVWTQDRESSVIYGMPMEVEKAGLSDAVMSLDDLAFCLHRCLR